MSAPQIGQTIRLTNVAPVSAASIGRTVKVTMVLGNAIVTSGGIFHLGWGTKTNPGNLAFDIVKG